METTNTLSRDSILESPEGRYKVVDVLGQGGFGITYMVVGYVRVGNVTTEAKFAIKEHFPSAFCVRENGRVVPKPDKQQEYERSKSDFIAEAKKLHALGTQCDNIVKVNEVFESNGTAYYVMQYINGESLLAYVKARKKLTYKEATALIAPIFDAVEFLHKSRINHLDIKPDNIMLHEGLNGIVPVLIDFGLSVHFKKNGDKTSPKGVQGVSEGYSPLEQYAGIKEFIPATDIYSLMATLLFCLTGEKPKSASEIKLSDVRTVLAGLVAPEYIDGICKGLNKSYEDRTSTVSILKSDLGLGASGAGTPTDVLDLVDGKKKRKRYMSFSIAAIAIIAVILLVVFRPEKKNSVAGSNTGATDTIVTSPVVPTGESPVDSLGAHGPGQEVKPEEPEPGTNPLPGPFNPRPRKPAATSGVISLGYGTWTGGIRNGKPDGKGRITFTATHKVDKHSSAEANPGDYFVATYDNGELISGRLYDSDDNLLKTIIP